MRSGTTSQISFAHSCSSLCSPWRPASSAGAPNSAGALDGDCRKRGWNRSGGSFSATLMILTSTTRFRLVRQAVILKTLKTDAGSRKSQGSEKASDILGSWSKQTIFIFFFFHSISMSFASNLKIKTTLTNFRNEVMRRDIRVPVLSIVTLKKASKEMAFPPLGTFSWFKM